MSIRPYISLDERRSSIAIIFYETIFKIDNKKLVSHVWEGLEGFGSPVVNEG